MNGQDSIDFHDSQVRDAVFFFLMGLIIGLCAYHFVIAGMLEEKVKKPVGVGIYPPLNSIEKVDETIKHFQEERDAGQDSL